MGSQMKCSEGADDSEWNGTHTRTLCFFSEQENSEQPTYIAESLESPGKRNYQHHRRQVVIKVIRGQEGGFSLHLNSFAALPDRCRDTGIDFNNDIEVSKRYIPYVKSLLTDAIAGATDVAVFDHTIRKASASKTPLPRQVRKIHIDQSPVGALGRARRHLDGKTFQAIQAGDKHFLIINVWKSNKGNVTDHPLTFADCQSLRRSDLVPVRQVYPGYSGETYALRGGDHQSFWYWSNMSESDVLLLQCFDSRPRRTEANGVGLDDEDGLIYTQCAHGSFELDEMGGEKHERQSIEVRCLVVL